MTAVRNILKRNPRLPMNEVEHTAIKEFARAQASGRMFTAKEVGEIEDKVFSLVNHKTTITHHRNHVARSLQKLEKSALVTRGATAKHSRAISFFDNNGPTEYPIGKSIDVNRSFINSSSIIHRAQEAPMTSTYAMTIS